MKAIALQALPILLPMLLGCASEVPDTRERADSDYRRVTSRIEATEEFELRKEMCAEAGGVLQVRRMSGSRRPPRVKEMRMATCALATNASEAF